MPARILRLSNGRQRDGRCFGWNYGTVSDDGASGDPEESAGKRLARGAAGRLPEVAAWSGAAFLSAGAGPVAAAVLSAAAVILPATTEAVVNRRRARAHRLLVSAGADGSWVDTLESDPRKLDLLRRALEAAVETAEDAKVDALARVLQEAWVADDDTVVDVAAQVIATLRDLEVVHVRVLAIITAPPAVSGDKNPGVNRGHILERQPGLGAVVDKVIADCERLGLIYDSSQGTWGMSSWADRPLLLTEYGRECLARLESMSS